MEVTIKGLVLSVLCLLCTGINYFEGTSSIQKKDIHCPGGFIQHLGSCYKFFPELLSWPESVTFCNAVNSKLVKIEKIEEFQYLKTKAHSLRATYGGLGFWIGATDAHEEGNWQWIDPPSSMTRDQVTWMPTEPSNATREDCALLWMLADYKVGDYYCTSKMHPICEIEISIDPNEVVG